jgi:hypothetical protein
VDGQSQQSTDGVLLAYDEQGDVGWTRASATIAPGVDVTRTIVVMADYAIDTLEWHAPRDVTVDLPLHVDTAIERGASAATPETLRGGDGTEDGFEFVHDTFVHRVAACETLVARAEQGDARLRVWAECSADYECWRAVAPGAPGRGEHAFCVLRARGRHGRHRIVWDWRGHVAEASFSDKIRVTLESGSVHEHVDSPDAWRIDVVDETSRQTLELRGTRPAPPASGPTDHVPSQPARPPIVLSKGAPLKLGLGREKYRRSELTWEDAGRPSATLQLRATAAGLEIHVHVPVSDRTFAPADAVNRYDNESPDINGDGVQLYLRSGELLSGWILVPESGSPSVRVRQVDGWRAPRSIDARWSPTATGYDVRITLPGPVPDALDIIVNEKPFGRERRRGQLVLSGAHGEFVYLRGDRHDRQILIPMRIK